MSTGNQNLDLLIKLLGQTTNDNDHIALMAMRKANDQLTKFNTTWEDLLKGRVTIVQDPFNSDSPLSNVVSRAAPPPTGRAAPPPPPYQRTTPPPPRPRPAPQPSATMHQTTRQAAPPPPPPPPPDPNLGRPNKFAARCYSCSRDVPDGMGILSGKTPAGKWKVECGPNFGHNAPYHKRTKRPAATTDDLADLLG